MNKLKANIERLREYLCGLGFGIYFVHRLRASIHSMSKFLFHVMVRLGYFSNAIRKEKQQEWDKLPALLPYSSYRFNLQKKRKWTHL